MSQTYFLTKRLRSLVVLGVIVLVCFGSSVLTQFNLSQGIAAIPKAIVWGFSNFYPTADSLAYLSDIWAKMQETLLVSIAAAVVAAIFAFIFAILGSRITKVSNFLAVLSRAFANLSRNIDVSVWSIVLLLTFGQTSLTGFFALFIASFGFLTRAFMETIDESGTDPVEALKSAGAGYVPTIFQAVVPSSISQIMSWILFMIETNIRAATLVGILTGSGIGYIFDLYYKRMDYHAASLVVVVIVISILLIEQLSNYVRRAML
ncbi:ABC transporter permease subunit [Sporolactobacillus sp. CPB3-1]|uniref:ABC transporter permease subunit n=1 Tax=Sporolactobacillus mangiferae TaxID=2940498 RepID=A0ABT0MCW4_9BACL|nr:ABC transporter permease subunit [Sporolactobacillus mangiferae]MCL1632155.1 ABC transporter permease subunit [Sporolactobacillus mangiferae]